LSRWFPKSSLFGWHAYGGWLRDSERTVDIVTGCFLLIDRSLWERLDGFATDFFMYGEDADLCLRARRLGFRPAVTPDATIIHHGSGTETDKARKITQILAASALLIRRHFSWRARCLGLLLLAARPGLAVLLSKRAFRPIWKDVWTRRHIWLAGKY
jgi:GT2 family glycosyltransferase